MGHHFGRILKLVDMHRWKVIRKTTFGKVLMELESDEEEGGKAVSSHTISCY
jgi:hypothetical protein